MTQLADLQHHELINELKDRGFFVLTNDQVEELDAKLLAGEILANMVADINKSISLKNDLLTLKLLEGAILLATGEVVEVEIATI